MTHLQNVGQAVKGKTQQVIGTVQKKMGYPVKGTINQIKGKANVAIADVKSEILKEKEQYKNQ
jgi:uncharacterized protein YjbJ (UPF0337 family)